MANQTVKIEEIAERSLALLKKVLSNIVFCKASKNPTSTDFRRTFVVLHARTICKLADDALDLEDRGRTTSPPLLVRAMLEGLFILGAAARNKVFAEQKLVYDFEAAARYGRCAAEKALSPKLKEFLLEQANEDAGIAADLRTKHKITGKFRWNPMECALEAGMFQQYAIDYAMYSSSTHAESFSMIFREKELTSGHVIRTVTFINLEAARLVLMTNQVSDKDGLIKEHANLFGVAKGFEQDGSFNKIYMAELHGRPAVVRGKRTPRFQRN